DVSSGGLITALLEMNFANTTHGLAVDVSRWYEKDIVKILFSENAGVVIQVSDAERVKKVLAQHQEGTFDLVKVTEERHIKLKYAKGNLEFDIDHLRNLWFETSYFLDKKQSGEACANERFAQLGKQPVPFVFPEKFKGDLAA